jgi:hypothetical protein
MENGRPVVWDSPSSSVHLRLSSRYRLRSGVLVIAFASLACGVVAFTGCGGGGANQATVSGKVTYNGAPVTGGTLYLGPTAGGPDVPVFINAEGNFVSTNVPEGEMLVALETESARRNAPRYDRSSMPSPPAGVQVPPDQQLQDSDKSGQPVYVKIPPKYQDYMTSGLTWTLRKGENKRDFELTD